MYKRQYLGNTFLHRHYALQFELAYGLATGLEFKMAAEILKTVLVREMLSLIHIAGMKHQLVREDGIHRYEPSAAVEHLLHDHVGMAVSYTHLDVYKRQPYASHSKKTAPANSRVTCS